MATDFKNDKKVVVMTSTDDNWASVSCYRDRYKIVHGSDFYQLSNYCEYKKMIGRLSIENRPYGLNNITLGVSICLDVVKEWVSTVEKTSTASKSVSRESRNLDRDRDFSISSRHQYPDQKVSIKIEKFVEIWKFRRFSTVCLNLDREVRGFLYFLVEISQSVETLGLDNVEISRQISTASRQISTGSRQISKISTCLDKSWQSRRVSTISTKISTRQSLDWKISILKISTEKKKKLISTVEKISTI